MSLTVRAFLFASLAAGLAIVELWSEAPLPIAASRITVALVALGLIFEWVYVGRHSPVVSAAGESRLVLGEDENLRLAFSNPGTRPMHVQYVPALPQGVVHSRETRTVVIPPGSTAVESIPARGVVLGSAKWQRIPVRVRGPLGLARWPRKLPLGAELAVVPDTLQSGSLRATSVSQGLVARSVIGGGMELHHLRPYRRGDSRSTIDWKATARCGELVTRVFGEDQHLEIMLAIDAGRTSRIEIDGMSLLSHYVNLSARFAEYAVIAEDRAGLVVFSDRVISAVPCRRGSGGVRQLRRALRGLTPQPVESNLIDVSLRIREMARHRSLVILFTDLYDRGEHSQLARSVRLLLPMHLPIVVGMQSEEVSELAHARAETWFDPYRSLAATEYQRNIDRNVARLRRMGAYAISARPRELDGRVFAMYDSLRSRRLV